MAHDSSRHPPRRVNGGGLPIDSMGGPTIDPTENVKSLMEASIKSLTREAELQAKLADAKFKNLEIAATWQEKLAVREREHSTEIRKMESDRVNSIRSVDVANAAATAAQLLSAVTTLATTAQATAETLRNQVAATAAAVASQTERVVNPIIERIALLEKSSYTGTGRQAGGAAVWAAIALGVLLLSGLIGLATSLLTRTQSPTPQVIYTPAPPGTQLPSNPPATVPR